jgi:stress response protein YsnF/sporulation protein YlmC with PRC-barrel domain
MPLPDIDTVLDWRGRTVVDESGQKIGKFDDLYLDEETSRPEWAAVNTGLLGLRKSLVPLAEAELAGEDVKVPFDLEHVKAAPNVDPDDQLSQQEEAQLYQHYGLDYSKSESGTGLPEADTGADPARGDVPSEPASGGGPGPGAATEPDTSGSEAASLQAEGDAEGHEVIRSEEELEVGTEVRPRERVRLKKYLVTESVTKTVPVTREEVRLEREPVGQAESGETSEGTNVSEDEEEVTLRQEEPVAEKGAVPQERLRLDRDTVTDEREIDEEVGREPGEPESEDRRQR